MQMIKITVPILAFSLEVLFENCFFEFVAAGGDLDVGTSAG
jgi:hypothetical protein